MQSSDEVLSPVDVGRLQDGWRGAIGGRVHDLSGATVVLADAFVAVRIHLAQPAELEAGSLLVLEAEKRQGALIGTAVVSMFPGAASGSMGREHDRLLRDRVGQHLRDRARAIALVRAWFEAERFVEVDTPVRVPSPGLDLHLDAFPTEDAFLITSPEYQMKRLVAGGMPRVYQLVHCLRRGESGPWHNPEFLMLEWYRSFAGIDHVMRDTERLIAHLVEAMCGRGSLVVQGRPIDVSAPFERMTVSEAFASYAGVSEQQVLDWAAHDEDRYFRVWVEAVEPAIALRSRPVFLTRYPAQQASLARLCPDDPRFCERFELYLGGLELCNGFGELVDPVEQRRRLERDTAARRAGGLPCYPIDEAFVGALVDGMPPSGGNALGMDRLIALCLGENSIAQVLAFPEAWLWGR